MSELLAALAAVGRLVLGLTMMGIGIWKKGDLILFGVGMLLVWSAGFEAHIRNKESL